MSATTTSRSPPPSVESDEAHSGYDDCIRQDLTSRVFVDFEVFIKHVLHVPDDWRTLWGPAIDAVKVDSAFNKHHKEYREHCDGIGLQEYTFHGPVMDIMNTVIEVWSRSTSGNTTSKVSQYHRVNDPREPLDGVTNNVNPSRDLLVLHKDPKGEDEHWADLLHILQVRPDGGGLCDGKKIPRLVYNGVDPILNHAPPPKPSQRVEMKSTASTTVPESTSVSYKSRKRPADGSSSSAEHLAKKKARMESTVDSALDNSTSTQVGEEDESSSTSEPEDQSQANPASEVYCHLLKTLSVPLIRSHATVILIHRNRLQLYHANRSVILVSSEVDLSEGEGLSKFIAMIIGFHCLPLEQCSVPNTSVKKNTEPVKSSGIPEGKVVQKGNQLEFLDDGRFTVNLGDAIHCDPAKVGRSTVVLTATSDRWPESELVVKISWPDSCRARETHFLEKANDEAEKSDGQWATKHLPRVFYAKDVNFDEDSALWSVARLFEDADFANGKYVYEQRTLRIIIQERLYPLKSLTSVRDIGQVIFDVACIHRWLYDVPGILHCDLSPNNIMCRLMMEMNARGEQEQKIYGVLTDYDLSSWKEDLKNGCTGASQRLTGTPPYMAQELLQGTSDTHLYRHDVESLFYIVLLLGARHTIVPVKGGSDTDARIQVVMREDALPYRSWFSTQNYGTVGCVKWSFLWNCKPIELSPAFEDFRPWLTALRYVFSKGFKSRPDEEGPPPFMLRRAGGSGAEVTPTPTPFDDETLGGYIDYSTIIEPTHDLEGQLEGLIIRYDPTSSPLPTGAVQASAL